MAQYSAFNIPDKLKNIYTAIHHLVVKNKTESDKITIDNEKESLEKVTKILDDNKLFNDKNDDETRFVTQTVREAEAATKIYRVASRGFLARRRLKKDRSGGAADDGTGGAADDGGADGAAGAGGMGGGGSLLITTLATRIGQVMRDYIANKKSGLKPTKEDLFFYYAYVNQFGAPWFPDSGFVTGPSKITLGKGKWVRKDKKLYFVDMYGNESRARIVSYFGYLINAIVHGFLGLKKEIGEQTANLLVMGRKEKNQTVITKFNDLIRQLNDSTRRETAILNNYFPEGYHMEAEVAIRILLNMGIGKVKDTGKAGERVKTIEESARINIYRIQTYDSWLAQLGHGAKALDKPYVQRWMGENNGPLEKEELNKGEKFTKPTEPLEKFLRDLIKYVNKHPAILNENHGLGASRPPTSNSVLSDRAYKLALEAEEEAKEANKRIRKNFNIHNTLALMSSLGGMSANSLLAQLVIATREAEHKKKQKGGGDLPRRIPASLLSYALQKKVAMGQQNGGGVNFNPSIEMANTMSNVINEQLRDIKQAISTLPSNSQGQFIQEVSNIENKLDKFVKQNRKLGKYVDSVTDDIMGLIGGGQEPEYPSSVYKKVDRIEQLGGNIFMGIQELLTQLLNLASGIEGKTTGKPKEVEPDKTAVSPAVKV